jgi:beta-xylosidase
VSCPVFGGKPWKDKYTEIYENKQQVNGREYNSGAIINFIPIHGLFHVIYGSINFNETLFYPMTDSPRILGQGKPYGISILHLFFLINSMAINDTKSIFDEGHENEKYTEKHPNMKCDHI